MTDVERRRVRDSERHHKRYAMVKTLGLCLQCKRAPRANGRPFCEACPAKKKRWHRKWHAKQRRAAGVPMRKCGVCREFGHDVRTCPDRPVPACERCGCRIWGEHVCLNARDAAVARRDWA